MNSSYRKIALPGAFVLFFLSGATGLIYQVLWVRVFSQVFGASVLAISTVLSVFMAGLAVGGVWGGRRAGASSNPLKAYGVLEGLLAVAALAVPWVVRAWDPVLAGAYRSLDAAPAVMTAVRVLGAALALFVPTFLMGATLPYLVRFATALDTGSRRYVARLYGINTTGAVFGTVVAAFWLLPAFGLRRTMIAGVTLNIVVALVAFVLARGISLPSATRDEASASGRTLPRPLLLIAAGVLGFCALAFEVLWTRALALSLGTTTYAFALVLAVFLIGIASGGAMAEPLLRRNVSGTLFGWIPVGIGAAALLLLPVFDSLPELFLKLTSEGEGTWVSSLFAKMSLAAIPMLVPTFLSGAAFPIAVALDRRHGSSRAVGDVYGANTLGAILGSWVAGFLLLPTIGVRTGIEVVALLQVGLGVVLLWRESRTRNVAMVRSATIVSAFALAVVFLPDWNASRMTQGGFIIGQELRDAGEAELSGSDEVVFLRDGISSTVTVRRENGEYTMQMNGVTEASTSGDLSTQVSVAGLPLVFHPAPTSALVVGLGGGITAATVAACPSIESIEVVEISGAVAEAASTFFSSANRQVLLDPRLDLVIGDGRNHLHLSDQSYDLIISLPSHVWNAGIGALMSREFYEDAHEKLLPGGLLCSWIQGYSVSSEVLKRVLAAVRESFDHVAVWRGAWGDLLILAGVDPIRLDVDLVQQRTREPWFAAMLAECGYSDIASFLSLELLAGPFVDAYVGSAPPNSDDQPFLEFEAPKLLYEETMEELFGTLYAAAGGVESLLVNAPLEILEKIPSWRRARMLESEARLAFRRREGLLGLTSLEEAHSLHPSAQSIRRTLAGVLNGRAIFFANQGDVRQAADTFLRAIESDPAYGDTYANLASLYLKNGAPTQAREAAMKAVELEPRRGSHRLLLGQVQAGSGDWEEAERQLALSATLSPRELDAWLAWGDALVRLNAPARADSVWRAAEALFPESPELPARRSRLAVSR